MTPASKGEIALTELDRVRAAGVRFGAVLADAAKREAFARGCGASAGFRPGLDARGLLWAMGIPKNQKVYGTDVRLVPPVGRACKLSRKCFAFRRGAQRRAALRRGHAGHPAVAARNLAAGDQG